MPVRKLSTFTDKDLDRQMQEITGKLNDSTVVPLSLLNGVSNLGDGYEPFGYLTSQNGIVHLYGLVNIPSGFVMGATIALLPVPIRPSADIVRAVYCDNASSYGGTGALSISKTGEINVIAGFLPGRMGVDISWVAKG